MSKITVLGVGLANPGNIGAIARAMQNFGLDNLILIKPKCDYLCKEALDRATHAGGILQNAGQLPSLEEARNKFDTLVGTTARIGTDYNIQRTPLSPEQFAKMLPKLGKVGLVIGREDHGLDNKEVSICDFIVTIPSAKKNNPMNVSHAASIIFYEIFKHNEKKDSIAMASGEEKAALMKLINSSLDKVEFSTKEKRETQRMLWKRIIGKSMLTKREAFGLCGFFRKL